MKAQRGGSGPNLIPAGVRNQVFSLQLHVQLCCKFQFSRKCLGSGILVLDKGEKAEEGPVSQLVANEEGYFRKLLKAAGKDVEDSFLELLVEEAQEEEHYDKRE